MITPASPESDSPPTVCAPAMVLVVPHTHWDREWYHPATRFRQHLVSLIDRVLDALAMRPGHFLLDGQAVTLDDYLAVRPDRRDMLAARLVEGSIEAGPWYVLSDELIPGGESLVRNLLAGRETLRRLGTTPPRVLYSPDAFGHASALPSLAAGFGIDVAVVWRGLGTAAAGGDLVRWEASDASTVLLHHLPPNGYEYGANLPAAVDAARRRWQRLAEALVPRNRSGVLLVLNGADHHAWQHDFPAALDALRAAAAPLPVNESSLDAWAREIAERVAHASLPIVRGELRDSYGYTWTLQGTLASRSGDKRRHALAERRLLRDVEPWVALADTGLSAGPALLEAAWRVLLLCQPHDTLCGCSVDAVARAMSQRLEETSVQGRGLRDDALLALLGQDPVRVRNECAAWRSTSIVRNRAPRPRHGVAELEIERVRRRVPVGPGSPHDASPLPPAQPFVLERGSVPHQALSTVTRHDRIESPEHYPQDDLVDAVRVIAWVGEVPGYGVRALPIHDAGEPPVALPPAGVAPVRVDARALDNGLLHVVVGEDGGVALLHRATGAGVRHVFAFEDVGDAGDLYTHSPVLPHADPPRFLRARVVHAGPLRGELALSWSLQVAATSGRGGRSTRRAVLPIELSLRLDAGTSFLRIGIRGENSAADHRLRLLVRTGIDQPTVHADAAFGPIRRAPIVATPAAAAIELPPATAPLHRYVTMSNDTRGASLFSDGLAEYEALLDGGIAITLVRAVGELSRSDLPERPGHAGWPAATPAAQGLGAFACTLALMLHGPRDDDTIALIERTADDVLLPLTGGTLRSALMPIAPTPMVELDGEGLAFGAIKPSVDGAWMVLRCVNLTERERPGRWRVRRGAPLCEARLSRLDELPGESLPLEGEAISFVAPPRGIVTLLVR